MRSVLLTLLAAASTVDLAYTAAIPGSHVLHEKREVTRNSKWVKRDRVESHIKLPVRIGLKSNPEAMEKGAGWLMDVSHPESENYGKHWSQKEVIEAFQPTPETVAAVKKWLSTVIHEDRITHTDNKAWFAFDATTEELEKLVHAEYYEHHDEEGGRAMLSTDKYYIPKDLQEHIDLISPGVKGVQVKRDDLVKRSRRKQQGPHHRVSEWKPESKSQLDTCDKSITPACLQALYQFSALDPKAKVSPSNSLGIFEEGDTYAQQDLDKFYANFTSYIPKGTHPILDGIDGGTAPVSNVASAGGESDLDFELAIPIVYPQTTTLYQTDDAYWASHSQGILNTFLDAIDGSYCTYSAYGETGNDKDLDPVYPDTHSGGYKGKLMCGTYKPTNVISISYGEQESDLPAYYQQRQCNEYMKLGMQGVSVVVASGDYGVGGFPGTAAGCLGDDGHVFSPTQPNSCPWLTNVGGTKIAPGKTVNDPEIAAYDPAGNPYRYEFASGGGFSNIFGIPDYQSAAVANYFKTANPPYKYYYNGSYANSDGRYNRNGRGIPDVAANGDNIAVYVAGKFGMSGGTSASAPIFAALLTRINEERIASGKGPVGFVNPTLYTHPEVLNDIVTGNNPGCDTDGFSCAAGWDPVTGLGTPNYPKMSKLFNSLA